MRNRMTIRRISILVLASFTMSLGAPIVEAQTAQPATGGLAGAVQTAKSSLASLWNVWATRPIPPGVDTSVKPTLGEAFSFFSAKGATPQQAEVLANNAMAEGQLATTPPPATSAPASWISRIFGGKGSTAQAADTAASDSTASSGGTGLFANIKSGFAKMFQSGRRAADTVTTGATTAVLTAKNAFDLHPYYQLPLSDSSAVQFRGQWQSEVKFTNGKWVVADVSNSEGWPGGVLKSGDAMARLEDIGVGADQGKITDGALAHSVETIKSGISNLRDKIFGSHSETLNADQANGLSKLQIQAQLMDQQRSIVDAQQAINNRIDTLTQKATDLGKAPPTDEIANLKKGYDTLEQQKQDISKRLDSVDQSPTSAVLKNAASWALYSVGITAGINVIGQVINGQKVDLKSAFGFVAQPSFWGGTAGGFVGSMLFQTLASSFLPPGMGIFFKVLPGFLGAAMGYGVGSSIFGGGPTNWIQTIGSTLASAGGYTLAYTLLGGAAAPGFALIGASIAAGALASFLLGKLFNHGQPTAVAAGSADLPAAGAAAASLPPAPAQSVSPPAASVQQAPAASETTPSLDTASAAQAMKTAYNEYINDLKDRKVSEARDAYNRYVQAKEQLDNARTAAAN